MDGVELLKEARTVGLTVVVEGERLRIRGPRSAEPVARRILDNKASVLAALHSGRPLAGGFCIADRPMDFGDVCAGWTPHAWATELRRKAARCDAYRPDIAEHYRAWAADIESKLDRDSPPDRLA